MSVNFSAESIKKYLPDGFNRLIFFDVIDSTNELCKREDLPDGTFVVAAAQTGGKGRMGRRFESKAGGVFLSFRFSPSVPADRLACVTGMAAVAAARAISEVAGEGCSVKWVNDILLGGKKIGGILCETEFCGGAPTVILGIGINANNPAQDFAWDEEKKAGSILTETGKNVDLSRLAAALIENFGALRSDLEDGNISAYLEEYRRICTTLGHEVTLLWRDGSKEFSQYGERSFGFAKAVSDTFGLVVEYPDGTREELFSGEVSVRGADGKYK